MIHRNLKKLQCFKCSFESSRKILLEKHFLVAHSKEQNFKCSICNKQLPNLKFLQSHLKHVHRIEQTYKCPLCCQVFRTQAVLSKHEKSVHKIKEFKETVVRLACSKCNKIFRRNSTYIEHMRAHKRLAKLNCQYPDCNEIFFSKLNYLRHVKNIHKAKGCRNCLTILKSNTEFVVHLSIHLECFQYYEKLTTPGQDNDELDNELKYNDILSNMPTKQSTEDMYIDEEESELLRSISNESEIITEEKIDEDNKLKCLDCNIKFNQELTIAKHMAIVHNDLQCKRCMKTFKSKDKILEHVNIHYVEIKHDFKCKKCSKTFRYMSSLQVHQLDSRCKDTEKPKTLTTSTKSVDKHGNAFVGPPKFF